MTLSGVRHVDTRVSEMADDPVQIRQLTCWSLRAQAGRCAHTLIVARTGWSLRAQAGRCAHTLVVARTGWSLRAQAGRSAHRWVAACRWSHGSAATGASIRSSDVEFESLSEASSSIPCSVDPATWVSGLRHCGLTRSPAVLCDRARRGAARAEEQKTERAGRRERSRLKRRRRSGKYGEGGPA